MAIDTNKLLIGKKFKQLRELSGMTQEDVAKRLGVTNEYVSMIESGKRTPSLEVLIKASNLFQCDLNSLIADKEQELSEILEVEGLNEEERKELEKFIELSKEYSLLEELNKEHPVIAPLYPDPPVEALTNHNFLHEFAEEMANSERKRLGLGDEPIRDIFALIETQGVRIIRKELKETWINGAFIFSRKGAFMLINSRLPIEDQIFIAAHEYCHYLKDRDKGPQVDRDYQIGIAFETQNPKEIIANAFALGFLIPETGIKKLVRTQLRSPMRPEDVIYLKRYFGVSLETMLYRLRQLDYLRGKNINKFRQTEILPLDNMVFGFSNRKPWEEYIPNRFLKLSLGAYYTHKISKERLEAIWKKFFDINTSVGKEILPRLYLYREKENNGKNNK
jgi:Zn-dependent peptidase ImmA (M78 family)/predicted transcriptional regulator